jgi:hypothetical protein
MASYLLPPSTLHAAAPGVLDVVFGPDGDFEGAPRWTGPVWTGERYAPAQAQHGRIGTLKGAELPSAALDLRVTSVADRLRRLCERALGGALYEMDEFGGTTLRAGDELLACWAADGSPTSPIGSEPVRFPAIGSDWLGPLVLALAPQIGALAEGRPGDAVAI